MDLDKIEAVEGHQLRLRLVQPEDAAYIYDLRMNPDYNSYLSPVSGTVADQKRWIENYKTREMAGEELYYVIECLNGQRCGVVRLYEITEESFTWGSIILDQNKPRKAALEATLQSMSVGFDILKRSVVKLEADNRNDIALAFYRRFGMSETGSDAQNTYFELTAADFNAHKDALWTAVKKHSKPIDKKHDRTYGSVTLVDLPVVTDPRGDLTFLEANNHVPFDIQRIYYLYNVPVDSERGGHAHLELEQVVFALSGSFRMKIDDGVTKQEFWLRNPRQGLYINRLIWREMDCFSQGAVCMVVASKPYDEADYLRRYDDFQKQVAKKNDPLS